MELSATLTNTLHLAHPPAGARGFSLSSIRGKGFSRTQSLAADLTDGFRYDKYLSCLLLQIAIVSCQDREGRNSPP